MEHQKMQSWSTEQQQRLPRQQQRQPLKKPERVIYKVMFVDQLTTILMELGVDPASFYIISPHGSQSNAYSYRQNLLSVQHQNPVRSNLQRRLVLSKMRMANTYNIVALICRMYHIWNQSFCCMYTDASNDAVQYIALCLDISHWRLYKQWPL